MDRMMATQTVPMMEEVTDEMTTMAMRMDSLCTLMELMSARCLLHHSENV